MPRLSPERWRELSPYLDQALDVASAERPAWLADLATRNAALAADLEVLLSEQDAVHESHFLEDALLAAAAPATTPLPGEILGSYRLVSPIGQGGMGSVWLAERCDGRYEGRVAVKLLDLALIGPEGEARFKREGTILARVTHPHIARLFDAGVSPGGQPYLVLEHVDGEPIDQYCNGRALGVEARLRLFLDVLDAVAHAHTNLVVHRDIKPANVLVSAAGDVKLLDFGIAKLIQAHADWSGSRPVDQTALTHVGARAMTPAFAAPEQVAGESVTTATDVYALGVLLYLLLSGHHPTGTAASSATLVRAILDTEPPRLSEPPAGAVSTDDPLAPHAARCSTTPHRLRKTLRGDLETIVSKALKKNPSERYASVTAMADDIRRYLHHQPISARPATLWYRGTSFFRRHGRVVAAGATALILLGLFTSFHARRLAQERDRAHREAAKAMKVSEVLIGVLGSADPYAAQRSGAPEPTARALLDASAEQVQRELAAEPELQAQILTMMGRTYRRLGAFDRAQGLLEQALVAGRETSAPPTVRVAQTLHELGVLLLDRGDYTGAIRNLELALEMRRALLGREHPDVAITLVELGRIYQDQGQGRRAEPLQREALGIRRKVLGDDHGETAVSFSDVASILRLNGDLDQAAAMLRQCLETNRRTRGEDHPNTAMTLHDLALITAVRGDYQSAEAELREALERQRRVLGERHPVVAMTLNNLSRTLREQGKHDEAGFMLEEALAIARRALNPDHQLAGIYTLNLANVRLAQGRHAEAETLLREGLRIRAHAPDVVPSRRRTFPEDDWNIGAAKSLLGAALVGLARYDEAEAVLLDALRLLEGSQGSRQHDIRATLRRLVALYDTWGKPDRAAPYRSYLQPETAFRR